MSIWTPIEWADSSANPVMGCDGCELWQPEKPGMTAAEIEALIRTCYAGQLHEMRGGNPGYAKEFLVPMGFYGRMAAAANWRDLRGTARAAVSKDGKLVRAAKPWLDGRPRHIFVSDMGDALSKRIPFEFLLGEIIHHASQLAGRRHVWMWLTKQPGRMAEFDAWLAERGIDWPTNLWAGTSITQHGQGARLRQLGKVRAAVRFVSVEPIVDDPGDLDFGAVSLAILGGESGNGARPTEIEHIRKILKRVDAAKCAAFVKQVGSVVRDRNDVGFDGEEGDAWDIGGDLDRVEHNPNGYREEYQGAPVRIRLLSRKGGNPEEWPADLRRREFPAAAV